MQKRDKIPRSIQRQVRKECGYGCVICGLPLFEYHHIIEWAIEQKHEVNNLVLLCPTHHSSVTKGLTKEAQVRRYRASPFNLSNGKSRSNLPFFFEGDSCSVFMGSLMFKTEFQNGEGEINAISVDGIPIVGFVLQDNQLLLNLNLFDNFNNLILSISNNEILVSNIPWDMKFEGTKLTIYNSPRNLLFVINFNPPNLLIIEKGKFYCNGIKIEIEPRITEISNSKIPWGTAEFIWFESVGTLNGILIGERSTCLGPALFSYSNIERHFERTKTDNPSSKQIAP